jgi:hypothetical protein
LDAGKKQIEANYHSTLKEYYGGKLTGTYEISEGALRVCYDLTGHHHPKSFQAKKGSRQVLYQFQRERP